jgi:hypothetical protein
MCGLLRSALMWNPLSGQSGGQAVGGVTVQIANGVRRRHCADDDGGVGVGDDDDEDDDDDE